MAGDAGRERSILKGGPLSRRVYWTDDLEVLLAAELAGGRVLRYTRTDQFVSVGAVYAYLSDPKLDQSARIYLWAP